MASANELPLPLILFSHTRLPSDIVNNFPKSWGIEKSVLDEGQQKTLLNTLPMYFFHGH